MASTARKSVDPRHRILKIPPVFHESKTRVHDVIAHGMGYQINVHTSCICNELVALTNRHLVDRTYIPFDKRLWARISHSTERFYPRELRPVAYEDVIRGYSGAKKRSYHNAMVELRQFGLQPKHMMVKMFVKPDRYPVGDIEGKDPRAIQYRSPHFNLAMGSYIKSFEEEIYSTIHYNVVSRTRVIAKGLNNYQRAELFLNKVEHFRNPRFVLLDHSRFDSTINVDHLKSTHRKYQRAFKSRQLYHLCRAQLHNTGYSKFGIKYRTKGTRMSGDCDTACGNSVINGDVLYGFLTESGVEKYDIILDGDDSVVIVEATDIEKLDYTLFGRMGFDTKHEVVKDIDEVEFCQCKIILAQQPVWVRNPARVLSHSSVSRKKFANKTYERWLSAVGQCEVASNRGVPVVQAYGEQLAALSDKPLVDDELRYRWEAYPTRSSLPVLADARDTFALCFGVHHEIQLLMEQHDYTANAFCSKIIGTEYEQFRVASVNRRIWSLAQLTPEFSGGCWWSSSQTRGQYPGQCSI
uniref:RNA-directed RNA polymerase n=1 Tax=Anoplophora glabripennis TaxID=217634 RepID=V5GP63_ANOGL